MKRSFQTKLDKPCSQHERRIPATCSDWMLRPSVTTICAWYDNEPWKLCVYLDLFSAILSATQPQCTTLHLVHNLVILHQSELGHGREHWKCRIAVISFITVQSCIFSQPSWSAVGVQMLGKPIIFHIQFLLSFMSCMSLYIFLKCDNKTAKKLSSWTAIPCWHLAQKQDPNAVNSCGVPIPSTAQWRNQWSPQDAAAEEPPPSKYRHS